MIKNKKLIDYVINKRMKRNDPVTEFAIRNKASPIEMWGEFIPFTNEAYNNIYQLKTDGIKLKFKHTTLTINARHKLN